MIKNLFRLNKYAINKNKSYVVTLPIKVEEDQSTLECLQKRYQEYCALLKDFLSSPQDQNTVDNILSDLEILFDCITGLFESHDIETSYQFFKKTFDEIDRRRQIFDKLIRPLEKDCELYRFCSYSTTLNEAKGFYHCPNNKEGVNTRFAPSNKPLWYLGYSLDVCKCEAAGRTGSLAIFKQKDGTEELQIFDLTQNDIFKDHEKELVNGTCYLFWWILACCYCFYDNDNHEKTCIFPQLLTRYIEESHPDVRGIKYYTVRNKDLDPNEKTYVNIALFTKDYNAEGYDMNLCEKFEMVSCEQNVTM